MAGIPIDFDKLLGYKLIARARGLKRDAQGFATENAAEECASMLRATIGFKPVTCLRYLPH